MYRSAVRVVLGLVLAVGSSFGGRLYRAARNEPVSPNRLIVKLRSGVRASTIFQTVVPGVRTSELPALGVHVLEYSPQLSSGLAEQLAARPDVEYVEPDRIRHTTLAPPDDPKYSSLWALDTVQALDAWGMIPARYLAGGTRTGTRIKVAVIDSGADCTHPDFRNAGGTSTDSAQGGQFVFHGSEALEKTTVAAPACEWQDDFGHGTHVAGTIAAAANNGTGVAGLAYPVELLIYKALDSTGHGPDSSIARAIMDAADAGAAVISMSLGETGYSQTLQDAINYAWARNILIVAAAGNDGSNEFFFPACGNHVLAVTAVDQTGKKATFSNFGSFVGIAAPGVNILSTVPVKPGSSGYAFYSGTSMAAPHVSATAALVAMATPGLAAEAIGLRLEQSAQSGADWTDATGYGILNAARALSGSLRSATSGGIAGQVLDHHGQPVAGATIALADVSAKSGVGGLFRVWNEKAGPAIVRVFAPGYDTRQYTVTVPRGGDAHLTVTMGTAQGEISGAVMSMGMPLEGAVVNALSSGLIVATATTAVDGRYWLAVPPGSYDLQVSAISHQGRLIRAQTVTAEQSTFVGIGLARCGWISGTVVDAAGRGVAGAEVSITGRDASIGAQTDSSGSFSTLGMPAGVYSIRVTVGAVTGQLDGVGIVDDYGAKITIPLGKSPLRPAPRRRS